jgi:putative peptidoglycan lipid II flippase
VVVPHDAAALAGTARRVSESRRVLSIASGTLASRITGLLRVLVLAYVLGFSPLADAFNLANTVPNMLFDLVLGGIASATFIPVFVERLAVDGERHAWKSISSVVTVALVLLGFASVLAWILAPYLIDGFTALGHSAPSAHHDVTTQLATQRAVATSLLRWFVPQIFFYGLIAVSSSLLNVRHKFGAPAWVPMANNAVCIAVLFWFHLVDPTPTLASVNHTTNLATLGLATSAGVLLQALLLVPSMARADLWRLSFRFDLRDVAVRAVARLGAWTLAIVVANQIALYVVLAFAFGSSSHAPISAYTYGWSFMQMPYAVVVVSVLSAMTPQLAALATAKDHRGFSQRLGLGLRQSLLIIIPLSAVLVILAQPIVALALNHANGAHSLPAGTVLAVLAAGLPGFTVFQVAIRAMQARQRARDAFWLYLLQNSLNIALALVMGRHSLGALTATVSISYSVAAIVALVVLARQKVTLMDTLLSEPIARSLFAAVMSAIAMAVFYNLNGWVSGVGLAARFTLSGIGGLVVYGGLMAFVHRRRRASMQRARRQ